MKLTLLLPLILTPALYAQTPKFRDAATHEDLAKTHQKAQRENPLQRLEGVKGPDLKDVKPIPDLLSRSDILSFGGLATLVPKRAILNQPADMGSRVNNFAQGSKIVGWKEFLQSNIGWITTIEVSRAQAEGKEVIDEKVVENYRKSSNLIIATYRGGPVSVMPLVEPEAKKTDSKPVTQTDKKP